METHPPLDPTQWKKLRLVLCELFPEPARTRLLAADAGLPAAHMDFAGPIEVVWENVLSEARKQGPHALQRLISEALGHYPNNSTLRALLPQLEPLPSLKGRIVPNVDALPARERPAVAGRDASSPREPSPDAPGIDRLPLPSAKNPFIVGPPVEDPRAFYGRRQALAAILDPSPGSPRALLFIGLRRSGKTSLLRNAARLAAEGTAFWPVQLDLQGSRTELEAVRRILRDVRLSQKEWSIFPDFETRGRQATSRSLVEILTDLHELAEDHDRRLLVLIDEAEVFQDLPPGERAYLPQLRAASQARGGPRTVLAAGRHILNLLRLPQPGSGSPFLNGFEPFFYLGPTEEDEADALIRQSRGGPGLAFLSKEERRALFDLAGGQVYLLQSLCSHLYEAWRAGRTPDIDEARQAVLDENRVEQAFGDDVRRLSRRERRLLELLLDGPEAGIPRQPLSADASALACSLSHLGLLETTADRIRFRCPLFHRWLNEHRSCLEADIQVDDDLVRILDRGAWMALSPSASRALSVFVSSTWSDLEPHRGAVLRAIDRLRCQGLGVSWVGMEGFTAADKTPARVCEAMVARSHLYVGILGKRYGSRVPGRDISFTELEYRTAEAHGLPCLIFLLDESSGTQPDSLPGLPPNPMTDSPSDPTTNLPSNPMLEVLPCSLSDPEGLARLRALKEDIRAARVVRTFTAPEDLAAQVSAALMPHLVKGTTAIDPLTIKPNAEKPFMDDTEGVLVYTGISDGDLAQAVDDFREGHIANVVDRSWK